MNDPKGIWYFEKVDLYEMLCPHKVKNLAEKHQFHHYQKGDMIYFEDQLSTHIYLIANGRVRIGGFTDDGREITKAILLPGEIFGEMALMGEQIRTDYAEAMDANVSVCPLTIEEMEDLMKNNRPLNLKIFKIIDLRFKKLERQVQSLVFKDARTRVIEFLYDTAMEKGSRVGFEQMIPSHLTHKDIASLTGTSRQTVTTVLNELRDANYVNFDRRRILIRDMDKLKGLIAQSPIA